MFIKKIQQKIENGIYKLSICYYKYLLHLSYNSFYSFFTAINENGNTTSRNHVLI
jgi:hypothetical protein